jgi:hypothetical protein
MSHRAEPEDTTTEAPAATPAPTLPTRAIDAETKRIKDCAVALCADVDAAGPGKAIDRLYLYLDLLDRKGNSIVTVNSFLVAIIGVVLFRPLGLFEPIAPTYPTEHGFWWGSVLVLGAGAMFPAVDPVGARGVPGAMALHGTCLPGRHAGLRPRARPVVRRGAAARARDPAHP